MGQRAAAPVPFETHSIRAIRYGIGYTINKTICAAADGQLFRGAAPSARGKGLALAGFGSPRKGGCPQKCCKQHPNRRRLHTSVSATPAARVDTSKAKSCDTNI